MMKKINLWLTIDVKFIIGYRTQFSLKKASKLILSINQVLFLYFVHVGIENKWKVTLAISSSFIRIVANVIYLNLFDSKYFWQARGLTLSYLNKFFSLEKHNIYLAPRKYFFLANLIIMLYFLILYLNQNETWIKIQFFARRYKT